MMWVYKRGTFEGEDWRARRASAWLRRLSGTSIKSPAACRVERGTFINLGGVRDAYKERRDARGVLTAWMAERRFAGEQ